MSTGWLRAAAAAALLCAIQAEAAPAQAAEALRCLDPHARRAAIASSRAVPLTRAVRAAKARHPGELVGARLCESGGTLVYVLTLLSQNGKVTRTTVDAATGRVVGRR